MTSAVLETRNLTVSYGEKIILNKLNMKIHQGEFVGILGPNGTGKSTLIKAITQLIDIQSGEIYIQNINNNNLTQKDRAKLISVVPQEFSIEFDFTNFDIVMMGRNPHMGKKSKKENNDYEIVKEAMILTNTWNYKDRDFNELSGGERQRVIVARAIAQQTDIILLDEPTSHLDIHHQLEVMELIQLLKDKKNITVMAVLHDINMAARFSDRLMLLSDGNVVAQGTPEEVIKEENLSKIYHMEMIVRENKILRKKEIIPLRVIKDNEASHVGKVHVISGGGSGEEILERLNSKGFTVSAGVLNQGDSDWEICQILKIPCADALPFSSISYENQMDNLKLIEKCDYILVTDVPFGTGNLGNIEVLQNVYKPIFVLRNDEEFDYTQGKASQVFNSLEKKPNFRYIDSYDEFIKFIE